MSQPAPSTVLELIGASVTWAAAVAELAGHGYLQHVTACAAVFGAVVAFLSRYDALERNIPLIWNRITSTLRRMRGKP